MSKTLYTEKVENDINKVFEGFFNKFIKCERDYINLEFRDSSKDTFEKIYRISPDEYGVRIEKFNSIWQQEVKILSKLALIKKFLEELNMEIQNLKSQKIDILNSNEKDIVSLDQTHSTLHL